MRANTIRATLEELVLAQAKDASITDAHILQEVKRRHPHNSTTRASVTAMRAKLRMEGHTIPSRKGQPKGDFTGPLHEAIGRKDGLPELPSSELPPRDFSTSNPGLHRLYVTYAQDDLKDFQACIDLLAERSRVNRSIMAGLIHEERAKLIRSDTSYQEAAWRLLADDLLPYEVVDHRKAEMVEG